LLRIEPRASLGQFIDFIKKLLVFEALVHHSVVHDRGVKLVRPKRQIR
jgi:hypothetical protein